MKGVKNGINGMLMTLIAIVVIVTVLVTVIPTLTVAFGNLSTTGLPFANFFASGGIIYLILGAAVLLGGIGMVWSFGSKMWNHK